ncbi:MAG: helix-turn-helix transcriptional regulator, partial [Eubacterium sp.]
MSLFSERLTQYIESKHVKIAALSRFLDYDRSTLYRIVKGTRPPASLTQVQSICQFLQLNPTETTALIDAYYATLHGEVYYIQHQSILSFINSFSLSTTPLDCPWSPRVSMVTEHCQFTTLDTPTALTAALFRIVSEAVQIEDGSLELVTQPDCINLYSIIDQLDVHGELLMTHLLCLDNTNGDASSATYNIDCLKQSLALLSRHRGYRAFYYYDDVLAHFSPYSLYPCLVLSRQGAVLFDAQCTSGFFIQTQDALNQLRSYTQRLKGHCIPMY